MLIATSPAKLRNRIDIRIDGDCWHSLTLKQRVRAQTHDHSLELRVIVTHSPALIACCPVQERFHDEKSVGARWATFAEIPARPFRSHRSVKAGGLSLTFRSQNHYREGAQPEKTRRLTLNSQPKSPSQRSLFSSEAACGVDALLSTGSQLCRPVNEALLITKKNERDWEIYQAENAALVPLTDYGRN